jgi:hypothetical protein
MSKKREGKKARDLVTTQFSFAWVAERKKREAANAEPRGAGQRTYTISFNWIKCTSEMGKQTLI